VLNGRITCQQLVKSTMLGRIISCVVAFFLILIFIFNLESKNLEIVMTIILILFALYLASWLYRIFRFQFTEK
jgi:hypothetical protein